MAVMSSSDPANDAPRRVRARIDWSAKAAAAVDVAQPAISAESVGKRLLTRKRPSGHSGCLVRLEDLLEGACREASREKEPRVALATCTRGCPAARLREWLFWHLSLGVGPVFLRWEGAMDSDQKAALKGPIDRGEVVLTSAKGRPSSAFQSVMARQVEFVHTCLETCRKQGIDFLLHLDDDELIFPLEPETSIPALFRRHVGSSSRCVHFENWEAIFPFEVETERPFSRSRVRFRTANQVLYCNGKSAANLSKGNPVYCSGVHHFCQYNRTYEHSSAEFGLHDDGAGCCDPSCCSNDDGAVVLHFDCPSYLEWRSKFNARAKSRLTKDDDEELAIFPFKAESVRVFQDAPVGKRPADDRLGETVYRRWRCLPGRKSLEVHAKDANGSDVEARFLSQLCAARRSRESSV